MSHDSLYDVRQALHYYQMLLLWKNLSVLFVKMSTSQHSCSMTDHFYLIIYELVRDLLYLS